MRAGRLAVGDPAAAEDEVAHGAVSDRGDERERGPRGVERVQVLLDRRPRPRLRAAALERSQVRLALGPPVRSDGRRREPVRVDHLRREALGELRGQEGVVERAQRRVGVEVDEPRAEHQPVRLDDLARLRHGRILVTRCTTSIPPARDADVSPERRCVAGVDGGSADQDVEHGLRGDERSTERERRRGHAHADQREDDAPKPSGPSSPAARTTPAMNPPSRRSGAPG